MNRAEANHWLASQDADGVLVTRHFATLGQRQVHYRRAGSGPPVLLLHQTPTSSAELLPLIRQIALRCTALAPDMPGYGASDPLPDTPLNVPVLADNVAAFMDELGIEAAAIYGYHTGASVANCLARRHPRRVIVTLCQGLLCLDDRERVELLAHYLEPFEPRWDGGHLAWLWSRLKDQSLFFPWYQRDAAARLALDATPVEALARSARDWLRCGARYRDGYAAAMRYDPLADLPRISTPHHIFCQRDDPLAAHLQRLPALPDNFQVRSLPTAQQCIEHVLEQLAHYSCAPAAAPDVAPTRPIAGHPWYEYVSAMGMQLRVLRAGPALDCDGEGDGDAAQRTLLVQHSAQGSLRCCAEMVSAVAMARPAMAIELPGHGETDGAAGSLQPTFSELAQLMQCALDALGVRHYDLVGLGAGAAVSIELLRRAPARVRSLMLVAPLDVTGDPGLQSALLDSYRPWSSDPHGGFLLRAWHEARDHLLFFPWYERRRAFAAARVPALDPALVHARSVDVLLADNPGSALRRTEVQYPLRQRLDEALRAGLQPGVAVRIAAAPTQARFAHARALAGSANAFVELVGDGRAWARQLVARDV